MEMQFTSVQRVADMTAVPPEEQLLGDPGEADTVRPTRGHTRPPGKQGNKTNACPEVQVRFGATHERLHLQYFNRPTLRCPCHKQTGTRTLADGPPISWPSEGRIQFKNVSLRYDEHLDPVVSDINLLIKPGQKVRNLQRRGPRGRAQGQWLSLCQAAVQCCSEPTAGASRDAVTTSVQNPTSLKWFVCLWLRNEGVAVSAPIHVPGGMKRGDRHLPHPGSGHFRVWAFEMARPISSWVEISRPQVTSLTAISQGSE